MINLGSAQRFFQLGITSDTVIPYFISYILIEEINCYIILCFFQDRLPLYPLTIAQTKIQ
jgi:hypothetical protein